MTRTNEPATDGGFADVDERTHRARTESMVVRSVGPDVYEVDAESGNTYRVVPTERRCSCPDHAIRGEHCKHLRRVAIEIREGRVSPPGRIERPCLRCGDTVYVRPDRDLATYCETHRFSIGDLAVDRETGRRVIVVGVSNRRADEVVLDATDSTVAEYPGNERYYADDPVIAAIYPGVDVGPTGPDHLRVYSFPSGRLSRTE